MNNLPDREKDGEGSPAESDAERELAALPLTGAMHSVGEAAGTRVGPYKLLQKIGEGGFGVVYMAEQERPVRRMVALKIIKPGMDTAQVVARFESERQALALMDHPHIAKVLDVGATDSGRPYFVMELVKGVPITDFCDKNRLAPDQRLWLFKDVCHAIQHAHQKGVIHRDIKPSNVMVTLHDGVPIVKVIDFGVAKATVQKLTEKTLFTAYGQMVGTPAYMSPEQAEMSGLDIDTRSDIYSLGVLLYELLTGTTPLDSKRIRSAGYAEIQRMIRDEEPPRPSSRLSSLRGEATVLATQRNMDVRKLVQRLNGDLDWIVMKCLEKDRSPRYETANGLARDVERFLHDQPVEAGRPSAGYRLRKFLRRNRTPVAIGLLFLFAMIAGIVGTGLGLIHARKARAIAEENEKKAMAASLAESESREKLQVTVGQLDRALQGERAALEASRASAQRAEQDAARAESLLQTMYTERGFLTAERGDSAQAALWFTEAARRAPADSDARRLNMVRANLYAADAYQPLGIFHHPMEREGWINEIKISPDCRLLAARAASFDGTWNDVRIWDLPSGKLVLPPWSASRMTALAWNDVGNRMAIGAADGTVAILELPSMTITDSFSTPSEVHDLVFAGSRLAVASATEAQLWETMSPLRMLGKMDHPDRVTAVALDRSANYMATYCLDGKGRYVQVSSEPWGQPQMAGPCQIPMSGKVDLTPVHIGRPLFSEDGRYLFCQRTGVMSKNDLTSNSHVELPCGRNAVGSAHGDLIVQRDLSRPFKITLIAAADQHELSSLEFVRHYMNCASFHPDGDRIIVGSDDGVVRVLSVPDLKGIGQPLELANSIMSSTASSDGRCFAVAEQGLYVSVWAFPQNRLGETRTLNPRNHTSGMPSDSFVELSPDERLFIPTGATSYTLEPLKSIQPIDLTSGERVGRKYDDSNVILGAGFLPSWDTGDDLAILTSSGGIHDERDLQSGSLKLVNWQNGELRHATQFSSEPRDLDCHPTRPEIAVVCAHGNVHIVDGRDLSPIRTWAAHQPNLHTGWYTYNGHVRYSPDGQHLVTSGKDDRARVWDPTTGQLRFDIRHGNGKIDETVFSPSGRYLATTSWNPNELRITDMQTGELAASPLLHPDWVFTIDFSPDEKWVVVSGRDGTVRVWDWQAGTMVGRALVHAHETHAAKFLRHGEWVVTGCDDGTIRLWQTKTGQPLGPPVRVGGIVLSIDVNRAETHVVVGGKMGHLVTVPIQAVLERAMATEPDVLDEWAQLISGKRQQEGGVTRLNSGERFATYEAVRRKHPELLNWPGYESRTLSDYQWGCRQATLATDDWNTLMPPKLVWSSYYWNLRKALEYGSLLSNVTFLDEECYAWRNISAFQPHMSTVLELAAGTVTPSLLRADQEAAASRFTNNLLHELAAWPHVSRSQLDVLIPLADRLVEKSPQQGNAWRTRALLHYRDGKHEEAIAAIVECRERGDVTIENMFIEALAQSAAGHLDRGKFLFILGSTWIQDRTCLPTQAAFRLWREASARLDMERRSYSRDEIRAVMRADWLQESLPRTPTATDKKLLLANLWALFEQWPEAEQAFSELMEEFPQDASLIYARSLTYLPRNDLDRFRDACTEMQQKFLPNFDSLDSSVAAINMVLIAMAMIPDLFPREAPYHAVADKWAAKWPADPMVGSWYAMSLFRRGEFQACYDEWLRVQRLESDASKYVIPPKLGLALAAQGLGRTDEANRWVTEYDDAVKQEETKRIAAEQASDASWKGRLVRALLRAEWEAKFNASQPPSTVP